MLNYIFVFILSLFISLVFTPLVRKVAVRIGAVDLPNSRRINKLPVPTIGGIAIYLGFSAAMFYSIPFNKLFPGIFLGGTFILIVGIIDDLYEMSAHLKFFCQITAALIPILFNIRIEFITNPLSGGMIYLSYWGIPLTILWIVSITNTVNLVDGLDGLAAGISAIAALTLFFVALQEGQINAAVLSLALAGSALGFLKYNFHPAKIFMGDAGAMFCGYILAVIAVSGALKSAATVTLVVPVLALGVPILDTIFAIIRRIYNGKPIGEADHGHIHHRLLALGFSQRQAVLGVYVISIFLGIIALIINGSDFNIALILLGFVLTVLIYGAWKIGIFTVELPAEGTSLENKV